MLLINLSDGKLTHSTIADTTHMHSTTAPITAAIAWQATNSTAAGISRPTTPESATLVDQSTPEFEKY